MKVVIINGYPGAGKDAFVNFCTSIGHERGLKVINILTSTPAKRALKSLGWGGEKTPEVRKILADLVDMSYENWDGPYRYVASQIEFAKVFFPNSLVFVHCREPHNIQRFKEEFDALTLFVDREENIDELEITNDADRYVEFFEYDHRVFNKGTLQGLKKSANNFLKFVGGWN